MAFRPRQSIRNGHGKVGLFGKAVRCPPSLREQLCNAKANHDNDGMSMQKNGDIKRC